MANLGERLEAVNLNIDTGKEAIVNALIDAGFDEPNVNMTFAELSEYIKQLELKYKNVRICTNASNELTLSSNIGYSFSGSQVMLTPNQDGYALIHFVDNNQIGPGFVLCEVFIPESFNGSIAAGIGENQINITEKGKFVKIYSEEKRNIILQVQLAFLINNSPIEDIIINNFTYYY